MFFCKGSQPLFDPFQAFSVGGSSLTYYPHQDLTPISLTKIKIPISLSQILGRLGRNVLETVSNPGSGSIRCGFSQIRTLPKHLERFSPQGV
eukprot:485136-Hanusia_phi.AAC.2